MAPPEQRLRLLAAAAEEDILGEAGGKPDVTGTWKGFVVNPAFYLEWSLTVSDYA